MKITDDRSRWLLGIAIVAALCILGNQILQGVRAAIYLWGMP